MAKITVLITGGAGFIGSHVNKLLSQKGYRTVVFDNLSTGHRDFVKWGGFFKGDLGKRADIDRCLSKYKVGAVMHFAAFTAVGESVSDPAKYYANNVVNTLNLLDAMKTSGVKNFIFSSSAAVYGMPQKTPITESHVLAPINPYGRTKKMVEELLADYAAAYGMKYAAFRYFNAAGADPDGELGESHSPEIHVIPRAIDAATGGPQLQVFGDDYPTPDGTCLRDYVHVSDLADAHVLALEAMVETGHSMAYNLGTGHPHSVREVIDAVERATGRTVAWTLAPRRPGDPAMLYAAAHKAHAELHWTPRFPDLAAIVRTAWEWHRAHPHGYED